MEGLVIGLIVMAIAALFNKKQVGEETAKPTNPTQTTRQRTVKRAEDYAKELYGELQSKTKDQTERTGQITKKVQDSVADYKSRETKPNREIQVRETKSRLTGNQERPAVSVRSHSAAEKLLPLEKEDLMKSIILAEILMPPKSKRK